jgi:hypothetical protein
MRASIVALVIITATRVAHAQYNVPAQVSGDSRERVVIATGDPAHAPDAKTPIGWELGGSLDFLTSDPTLAGKPLKFTDVVFFRAHGLVAIGKHLELFAGTDLLPKQPSYTDELAWQGALAGARMIVGNASVYARGQFGPLLERTGWWSGGEAAAQYRYDLAEQTLWWESTLGGTYTQLFPEHLHPRPLWQTELLAQTGIAVRDKKGLAATWLSFAFHFPLASQPAAVLDPQTRVDVYLGIVLGVTRTLDLFMEVSILDRGDFDNPATTLPILAGGFDQHRLVFGFNRRFGERRR